MALDFTDATGNLFNRLGAVLKTMEEAQTYQGTTIPTQTADVNAQYATDVQDVPTLAASETNAQAAAQGLIADMAAIAQNTLIDMVMADTPQPAATLAYCIPELITQMIAAPATVLNNIVSATITAGGANTGSGTVIYTLTDGYGDSLQNVLPETINIACITDSQAGQGASPGQETFQATSSPAVDKLNWAWPGGSAINAQLTAASAAVGGSTANALTNSNFQTWTVSNIPDGWTIAVGTAGTTVLRESVPYYATDTYSLGIVGTGAAELTQLTFPIQSPTIGIGILQPQTVWCIAFWVRTSAEPAAGVLNVSLRDGSNMLVGTAIAVTLSGVSTTWLLKTVTFSLPLILPATLNLAIQMTTAITSGKSVYIADMVLAQMTQLGAGAFVTVIPGSVNFIRGDTFTLAVANDLGGKFQTWFNRVFGMDQLGYVLPSAASPDETISDSLIT